METKQIKKKLNVEKQTIRAKVKTQKKSLKSSEKYFIHETGKKNIFFLEF